MKVFMIVYLDEIMNCVAFAHGYGYVLPKFINHFGLSLNC